MHEEVIEPHKNPQPDRVCLHALSKRYGSVTVLDNVSFSIKQGEVHGLLGANGAGKSTLCRILSGLIEPTAGQMFLDDRSIQIHNKQNAEALGIEIVQQELNLIPTLTVAENLLLSKLPHCCGVLSRRLLNQRARDLLAKVGLQNLAPQTPVRSLGIGQQQLIEIAKSLQTSCKLLILDEPTASLSGNEVANLFLRIEELKRQGTSILYISHRLDEVKTICDRITILRDGKYVLTEKTAVMSVEEMVAWMSGDIEALSSSTGERSRKLSTLHDNASGSNKIDKATDKAIALRLKDLSSGTVKNISFSVRAGEVLGITGLVGAGRTELLRAIYGADRATSGAIYLHGDDTPKRFSSPAQAVAAGLAMITEDRKSTGLLLSHSIADNATLAALKRSFSRWGVLRKVTATRAAVKTCTELATKYESIHQMVSTLSGGNQQKVVVAKWLLREANIFLFDEPTRGIDVAARRIIYDVIRQLAQGGAALLVVSSDMEELFSISDRIAVLSDGRLTDMLDKAEFDRQRITNASFAGHSRAIYEFQATTPGHTK
ncbi:sugar ABC transporter ATP-binding protein [Pirellulaceae bacterium SH449]